MNASGTVEVLTGVLKPVLAAHGVLTFEIVAGRERNRRHG
jgi:hypothetical protein